ncbi:serine protease 27-like [Discoglossus pictus]
MRLHLYTAACSALLALGFVVTSSASGCGQPMFSDRVVGGKDSLQGKWPWTIALFIGNSHTCGGSLISKTFVLTAAHCFARYTIEDLKVFIGTHNLSSLHVSPSISRKVKTVTIHPKYKGEATSGDLALVELDAPVTYNNYILPICVPSSDQELPSGKMCWVAGWGNVKNDVKLSPPYTMQEVDLPIINTSACNDMYLETYKLDKGVKFIEDDMLCAGYKEGQKDSCQGDSGGPLACKFGNYWLMAGIVSFGGECAAPNSPGVYTKIPVFSSWIRAMVPDLSTPAPPESSSTEPTSTVLTYTPSNKSTWPQMVQALYNSTMGNASTSITPTPAVGNSTANKILDYVSIGDTGECPYAFVVLPVVSVILNVLRIMDVL